MTKDMKQYNVFHAREGVTGIDASAVVLCRAMPSGGTFLVVEGGHAVHLDNFNFHGISEWVKYWREHPGARHAA